MATNNDLDKIGEAPIGSIARYDFAAPANSGWLETDGSVLSQASYPELYATIGHAYENPQGLVFATKSTGFGTKYFARAGYGSDGYWVGVGGYDAVTPKLLTATVSSPPSNTWTTVDHGAGWISANPTFNGTYWVASYYISGSDQGIYTATDPTSTWTKNNIVRDFLSVGYGNGVFVAGTNGKSLYTATNPTSTWTQRLNGGGTEYFYGIGYGNSIWVAVGEAGVLYTAIDPTSTWTSRTSGFGASTIYRVAYGNGYWVASGADGKLFTATDPTSTWTSRTTGFGTTAITGLAYNPDGDYWMISGGTTLAVATNPTGTWTQITNMPSGGTAFGGALTYGDGYFISNFSVGTIFYAKSLNSATEFQLPTIADNLIRVK